MDTSTETPDQGEDFFPKLAELLGQLPMRQQRAIFDEITARRARGETLKDGFEASVNARLTGGDR